MDNHFYLAQIAKLYYVDKVKQNEIAKRFGITPMMVSRSLREAEQKGIVTVHVKMPWPVHLELGKRVKERYDLSECVVLDIVQGVQIPVMLGGYLADYIANLLRPDMVIGLSWGYTISRFVDALPYVSTENCSVIQLTGAFVSRDYTVTPTHIVQEVSKKLGARVHFLNAPLYVASQEVRRSLAEDPTNLIIRSMAERSDINIIGASQFSRETTTYQANVITPEDYDELEKLGAIGDCAGTFLNSSGEIIEWSRSALYTGIPLRDIQKAKSVVCVAGEPEKAEILRVSMQKKYIHVLLTTRQTAERLLV